MDSSLVFVQIFHQLSTERFDIFYFKLAVVETPSPFLRLSAGLISKGLTVPNHSLKRQRTYIV